MTEAEFNAKEAEILSTIPREFHSWASYKAYEDGHSAGREEIICCLQGLLDGLPEVIKAYDFRRTAEILRKT